MNRAPFGQVIGTSSAIVTSLQCGALEALASESFSPARLAAHLELDPVGVARLLELLESIGVLERQGNAYRLHGTHRTALEDMPGGLAGMRSLWGALPDYLRSGTPLLALSQTDDRGRVYAEVVTKLARMFEPSAARLARALSTPCKHVLDVGAGSGVWSLAMAQRDQSLQVTAIDRPEVLPRFLERAATLGLSDRVEAVNADYHDVDLERFDYDRVLLANVLHLESESAAARLVTRAADGLRKGGELVTIDAFPPADLETRRSYDVYRLHLAMRTGGRRAHDEASVREWYRRAGFEAQELLRLDPGQPELAALVSEAA